MTYNDVITKLPFDFVLYIEFDNDDGTDGEINCGYSRDRAANTFLKLDKPFKEIIYDDPAQGGTVTAIKAERA